MVGFFALLRMTVGVAQNDRGAAQNDREGGMRYALLGESVAGFLFGVLS